MRNRIRKLSLFGSILTPLFRHESDIDILLEFEPESKVSLFDIAGMVSRYFRDDVIATAAVQI